MDIAQLSFDEKMYWIRKYRDDSIKNIEISNMELNQKQSEINETRAYFNNVISKLDHMKHDRAYWYGIHGCIKAQMKKEGKYKMELQTFNNDQFGTLRTAEINNKIYYCGNDVAKALGYVRPKDAVAQHCKGAVKHRTPTNGGIQELSFIPEGDVYRLTARSKLPQAEKFESWVFDEVLPQIAHTGAYAMTTEEKVLLTLQYSKEISDRVNKVEEITLETKEDVDQLKNNMVIDRSQKHQLIRAKNRTIIAICGGTTRMPAYKCKELVAKIARTMWRQYWDHFDVASYEDTPAVRYDEALEYINQWLPDNNLRLEVARINQGDANVD